jgi:hypothetical protein
MNTKSLVWIGVFVGSTLGSLVPTLWGAGFLSFSSVIFTAAGGFLGLWLGYKLSE